MNHLKKSILVLALFLLGCDEAPKKPDEKPEPPKTSMDLQVTIRDDTTTIISITYKCKARTSQEAIQALLNDIHKQEPKPIEPIKPEAEPGR